MRLLTLDLSTKTGWAFGHIGETPRSGLWKLGEVSKLGRLLSCMASELEAMLRDEAPDLCVFEAPLPVQSKLMQRSPKDIARMQIGLAGIVEMICFEQGVPCEEADCRDARQLVMGHQPSGKDEIMKWCEDHGRDHHGDDNEADALILWDYRRLLEKRR